MGDLPTNDLSAEPIERAIGIVGGRWKMAILRCLMNGPRRQSELLRLIPRVSQKVLIRQLRQLEAHGMVRREVLAVTPPHVVYTATNLARSLRPIADALCAWGREHASTLDRIEANPRTG